MLTGEWGGDARMAKERPRELIACRGLPPEHGLTEEVGSMPM